MFCPECGSENKDEAIFCLKCGVRINLEDPITNRNGLERESLLFETFSSQEALGLALGVLIVFIGVMSSLGKVFISTIGNWGGRFGEFMGNWGSNFGEFMGNWGSNFGEFMGNWGEGMGRFFAEFVFNVGTTIGASMVIVIGFIIVAYSLYGKTIG
jgi:hypothetical protein